MHMQTCFLTTIFRVIIVLVLFPSICEASPIISETVTWNSLEVVGAAPAEPIANDFVNYLQSGVAIETTYSIDLGDGSGFIEERLLNNEIRYRVEGGAGSFSISPPTPSMPFYMVGAVDIPVVLLEKPVGSPISIAGNFPTTMDFFSIGFFDDPLLVPTASAGNEWSYWDGGSYHAIRGAPEPTTVSLFSLGVIGLLLSRRRSSLQRKRGQAQLTTYPTSAIA